MTGAAMSLTAAASGFVVFLLSVSVVQAQDGWGVTYTATDICAIKGSTVNISCTYTYPSNVRVQETFWFTKESNGIYVDLRTDPEYSGRVQYLCEDKTCTLTIRDLRETDSAQYKFRFITNQPGGGFIGLPGVTLTVTALQVQVTRVTVLQSYTEAELKCLSSDSPAGGLTYVWFQNGQKVPDVESASYKGRFGPGDNISCALKEHEACPSPPVYGPKLLSVSVSPSAEIVEGSSVTLTCSSDANPAANYTWYKKHGNPSLQPASKRFNFSSIQSSDSGEYYCTAENDLGRRTSGSIFIHVTFPGQSVRIMNIIRLTLVVLMLIPLLVLSLWTRKKKTLCFKAELKEPVEMTEFDSDPVYPNISALTPIAAAQTDDSEEQEDLV
ncbi:sialoadhesin-like isoform X2 [Mastacembelus armatus]|uniref:sialoadhesin-like isoform X2 n=1 Tax=Mastacembelus armatus TaxID=205130 RepID=UPI000E457E68|nr:sialoadhesin-like isoform X2 [Mastacembelus armatus]